MGWIAHVAVDVALGIGLIIAGLHGHGPDYLVLDAAGAYLLLATLLTDGPVRAIRLVPRFIHRVADGIVAVALVASPLLIHLAHDRLDLFATSMALAVGVIILRDALVSNHERLTQLNVTVTTSGTFQMPIDVEAHEAAHASARYSSVPAAPPTDAGSASAPSVPGAGPGQRSGSGSKLPASAGRIVGRVSSSVADQAPDAARKAGVAAGRAGAVAARAGRAARAVRASRRQGGAPPPPPPPSA